MPKTSPIFLNRYTKSTPHKTRYFSQIAKKVIRVLICTERSEKSMSSFLCEVDLFLFPASCALPSKCCCSSKVSCMRCLCYRRQALTSYYFISFHGKKNAPGDPSETMQSHDLHSPFLGRELSNRFYENCLSKYCVVFMDWVIIFMRIVCQNERHCLMLIFSYCFRILENVVYYAVF